MQSSRSSGDDLSHLAANSYSVLPNHSWEDTLQYILDWEHVLAFLEILVLWQILTHYREEDGGWILWIYIFLLNGIAALWIYWKCIVRPSMQYYELLNHIGSIGTGVTGGVNGQTQDGRGAGEHTVEMRDVRTTEDIMDATSYQSRPAFGGTRVAVVAAAADVTVTSVEDEDTF